MCSSDLLWLAIAVQVHVPPASLQVVLAQPSAEKAEAALVQVTGVDETERHAGASGNVIMPVVTVLSVYVPLLLAIQVPVTCREPVTGTVMHPRLAKTTSMSPERARHDDATVHEPTAEPPQGVTPGQFGAGMPPVPPLPLDPPEPVAPTPLLQPLLAAMAEARTSELTSLISLMRIRPRSNCHGRWDLVTVF